AMPVTTYNFISLPDIRSRHPLWHNPQLPFEIEEGKHAMACIRHERRETWGSDAVTGRVREVIHLPTNSWISLQAGVVLAVVCLSLLTKFYWLALGSALVAAVIMLRWSWFNGAHPQSAPVREDDPVDPPLHSRTFDGPGRWGMLVTLMANGSLYASLLFGWFYLWTAAPQWQAPDQGPLGLIPLLVSGVLLSGGVLLYHGLVRRLRRGVTARLAEGLWLVALLGGLHLVLLTWLALTADLSPTSSAHDAVLVVMLGYLLFHGVVAAVVTAMQAVRVRYGYVGAQLPYEPMVLQPFWSYTLGVFWLSFAAFILLPMAW
ncbi:MAG: cytochrome ubiquinol oxidase subunit I, partial [Pseudomonas sp.]